ncbi:MAG TPA: DNA polymerase [Candidatus Paceibacterota bacterium]|nr:DNA polymerase [Candidatus Paceibacterota bacterium]
MATKKEKKSEDTKPLRLVLLDTHAILHRAYHAIPDLSTSKGEPTGALFGLVSTLLKTIQDLKPDYMIAARDLPGATVRHEVFEAYKATRQKTDDALIAQLTRAPIVYEAFGIPLYEAPSFEADDVVGTIVREVSARRDLETIIVSGDMDTLQLVSPRVSVYTMRKGIADTVLYDEAAVEARYGFGPERVVDYKALRGDPSDNIPGIRGIGEKTASDLVKAFGSIEDMYKALEQKPAAFEKAGIKPRIVGLLKEGKEAAAFSKHLATIRTDAPVRFVLPKRAWHLADHVESVVGLCDELEFRALKARVRTAVGGVESDASDVSDDAVEMQQVDPRKLKETSVALWLLRSDLANPTQEDILHATNTDDFDRAREAIFKELRETGRLQEVFDNIEQPLIAVVDEMNARGVYLDVPLLESLRKEYTKQLGELAGKIFAAAGHEFNINSPRQLGVVLYDELKIGAGSKVKKTATGARTTREDELVKLAEESPVVADVLAYRQLQKLLGTYIEKMPKLVDAESRLHAQFVQAGAATGRMSSQDPNLQNIPIQTENGRRIRAAFAAPKGKLIASLDYSQVELRVAAGLSGDQKLVEVFKTGGDVHTAVASEVFGVPPEHVDKEMRRRAKVINFGILYGMGSGALRANLGPSVSREEAQKYLDEYFAKYAGLARFVEQTVASAARLGYTETLFGRRRYFSGFNSPLPQLRAAAERMAVNAPIQGTQADLIKLAMVQADELIKKNGWEKKAGLLMQVHDELVYEVDAKEGEEIARAIRGVMESVAPTKELAGVPIVAEIAIGKNWGATQKLSR